MDDDIRLPGPRAAEYLGIKPGVLRNWRWSGRGPKYTRLGNNPKGRVVYRKGDLDDWLDARTFNNTAEEHQSDNGA